MYSKTAASIAMLLTVLLSQWPHVAGSAVEEHGQEERDSFAAVVQQRASKIVSGIQIDQARSSRVVDIVAKQYRDLSLIHEKRAAALLRAERKNDSALHTAAENEEKASLYELHTAFVAALSAELTPEQVDAVKDGMTYGVLPNTWRVYQEMLPDLSDDQKRQILAWLIEARERAMDAGSSEEKHGWFGKYKGRINNYLTAAGYDMKKAEKEMFARRKKQAESVP